MRYDAARRRLVKRFVVDDAERAANRATARRDRRRRSLRRCRAPRSRPTSTIARADLAIDFCEDVPPLPRADVDRIVAMMEAEGHDGEGRARSTSTAGSARYDKLAMTRTLLREAFGDRPRRRARALRVRGRFAQRRADVRVFSATRSASPTCAPFLDRIATPPALRHARARRRRLRRAGGLPARNRHRLKTEAISQVRSRRGPIPKTISWSPRPAS